MVYVGKKAAKMRSKTIAMYKEMKRESSKRDGWSAERLRAFEQHRMECKAKRRREREGHLRLNMAKDLSSEDSTSLPPSFPSLVYKRIKRMAGHQRSTGITRLVEKREGREDFVATTDKEIADVAARSQAAIAKIGERPLMPRPLRR